MDPDEGKDKFYINLNVQYKASQGFSSEASTQYKFDKALIDKSGNYQVCVTDMQVDTKNVPLFVAEYMKTQDQSLFCNREDARKTRTNTEIKLNYWVQVYADFKNGEQVYLRKPVRLTAVPWTRGEPGKYEYDNDNQNAFIYSHQEFLDMINIALNNALPAQYRGKSICGFIIRNGKITFIVQDHAFYQNLIRTDGGVLKIYFSNSLYQYIGVGFPIINRGSHWEYDFIPLLEKPNGNPFYYSLTQTESTLQSWNGCKAIVCYTNDLPVSDEIFPTTAVQPHLSHYGSSDAVNSHYILGKGEKKILFVYYIDYNRIRTLSNGIVVHNMCVDDGLKIDLNKTLPVDTFDVHIGWLDAYGNLFPLKLTYGGCCNVRLCFTRKKVVENYDYTKGPSSLPILYPPPDYSGYYITPYTEYEPQQGQEMQVDENTKQGLYGWTPSMENNTGQIEQHLSPRYEPESAPEMPIEPLTLFAQHLKNAVEQQLQNNNEEGLIVPQQEDFPPSNPVTTEEPIIDEKEQFYKRQKEILDQYKEFNNNLN